jgi:hypothetical protein
MTGLLAVRLWLQMSDPSGAGSGARGVLFSVTEVLVAPYRGHEPEVLPVASSAVFEFSTLLALQAYLVATLAIVLVIVAARLVVLAATAVTRDAEARTPAGKRTIFTLQPVAVAASAGSTAAMAGPTSSGSGSRTGEESNR